jgi:transcriptional regulator NrdR family protein
LKVSIDQIDNMVANVESDAFEKYEREVPSSYIGELVMRELRKTHHVAYIRYASVYKEFKDVSEFMEVLEEFVKSQAANRSALATLLNKHTPADGNVPVVEETKVKKPQV